MTVRERIDLVAVAHETRDRSHVLTALNIQDDGITAAAIVPASPFIADAPALLVRTVHVNGIEPAITRVQLSLALRAQPEPRPRRGDWVY